MTGLTLALVTSSRKLLRNAITTQRRRMREGSWSIGTLSSAQRSLSKLAYFDMIRGTSLGPSVKRGIRECSNLKPAEHLSTTNNGGTPEAEIHLMNGKVSAAADQEHARIARRPKNPLHTVHLSSTRTRPQRNYVLTAVLIEHHYLDDL